MVILILKFSGRSFKNPNNLRQTFFGWFGYIIFIAPNSFAVDANFAAKASIPTFACKRSVRSLGSNSAVGRRFSRQINSVSFDVGSKC